MKITFMLKWIKKLYQYKQSRLWPNTWVAEVFSQSVHPWLPVKRIIFRRLNGILKHVVHNGRQKFFIGRVHPFPQTAWSSSDGGMGQPMSGNSGRLVVDFRGLRIVVSRDL
jgi:hypothetical protein